MRQRHEIFARYSRTRQTKNYRHETPPRMAAARFLSPGQAYLHRQGLQVYIEDSTQKTETLYDKKDEQVGLFEKDGGSVCFRTLSRKQIKPISTNRRWCGRNCRTF